MNTKLLEILNHEQNAGLTIVTNGNGGVHISNTWNHYVKMSGETLLIPAGGMVQTEKNILNNPTVQLSITNPFVQGFQYPGTGVVVKGLGEFITEGDEFNSMKMDFPWIRAIFKIRIDSVKQTQ